MGHVIFCKLYNRASRNIHHLPRKFTDINCMKFVIVRENNKEKCAVFRVKITEKKMQLVIFREYVSIILRYILRCRVICLCVSAGLTMNQLRCHLCWMPVQETMYEMGSRIHRGRDNVGVEMH